MKPSTFSSQSINQTGFLPCATETSPISMFSSLNSSIEIQKCIYTSVYNMFSSSNQNSIPYASTKPEINQNLLMYLHEILERAICAQIFHACKLPQFKPEIYHTITNNQTNGKNSAIPPISNSPSDELDDPSIIIQERGLDLLRSGSLDQLSSKSSSIDSFEITDNNPLSMGSGSEEIIDHSYELVDDDDEKICLNELAKNIAKEVLLTVEKKDIQ